MKVLNVIISTAQMQASRSDRLQEKKDSKKDAP